MASRDRRDMGGMTGRAPGAVSSPTRESYGSGGFWPDPFSQFRRLTEQMDRWFDTVGMGRTNNRLSGQNDNPWAMGMWAPEMETFLRDDQFVIRMDLPGLSKDEVNVEVTDDSVVIHGERQKTHEEERDGFYRSERSYGRFYREVQLPEGAQPETAKASYRDGVLEVSVTAPPRQITRPRRVEIGSGPTSEHEERQRGSSGTSSASSSAATGTTSSGGSSVPITDRTTERPSVAHDRE
jgi:HSP20 family protein